MHAIRDALVDKVVGNFLEDEAVYSLASLLSALSDDRFILVENLTASLEEKHSRLLSHGPLPAAP